MTTILTEDLTPEQENEPVTKGFFKRELKQVLKSEFEDFSQRMFRTFATKDDIKDLATKDDLKQFKNEILEAVDGITKDYKNHKEEHDMNKAAHDRFEERITAVEVKTGIKPATA